MAEDQDDSQKTEEPTQRRIEEAFKRGQMPVSREVNNFLMLLALTLFVISVMPWLTKEAGLALRHFIEMPDQLSADSGNLRHHFIEVLKRIGGLMMIVFVGSLAMAVFSSFAQNGFRISGEPLIPKLEKISPLQGLKRLFSLRSFVDFLKGVLKISIIGFIAYKLLMPHLVGLELVPSFEIKDLMSFMMVICLRLLMWSCVLMFIIAAADLLYQRFEFFRSLKMSRQELKEEFKETQGDPTIKARLRQIRMERARKRRMAEVPKADVVITNPEHYAVALKYDASMVAPMVVAKGADLIALKIREIATQNNVPIVRNPPLARALHESVEIEEEVPLQYYQAVAEVISYVMKLKKPQSANTRL